MIAVRRPSQAQIDAYRAERERMEPTTSPTPTPPVGYRQDTFNRVIAQGGGFDRACDGLRQWVAHRHASVDASPPDARLVEGTTVGLLMRQPGIWILVACRITEVIDEPNRYGFVYATLPGHMVDGYESFVITRDGDAITFEVSMVSRPASPLIRLAGPIGRMLQRQAVNAYLTGLERWVDHA